MTSREIFVKVRFHKIERNFDPLSAGNKHVHKGGKTNKKERETLRRNYCQQWR